jgi:hypothetical protein
VRQRRGNPGRLFCGWHRGQATLGALEIAAAELDEAQPQIRLGVGGIEPQRHLPLVGGPLEIPAIRVDARENVVRVRQVRMAIEAAQRHAQRDVQLAGAPQRVRERHEHEARWIAREVIAQAANLVRHPRPP